MSKLKKIVSILLVTIMLVNLIPADVFATPNSPQTDIDDGMTIEGTNGFGNLLSEDLAEAQEENERKYDNGYSVIDLVIELNSATVTYDSMEEALLVVALYTEDGLQLLQSAETLVDSEESVAVLTFEGDMPEYFRASAYLVDTYDLSPLCEAYETPMYTREMQELLASTVEDYDADRVLNLDEDDTTNFAVYAESTIVIEGGNGVNEVISADDENGEYVISNADASITGLQKGDVFAYPYDENEILIVKVKKISVNGTTATITGDELEMEEVFSHVKIESGGTASDMEVDESTGDADVTYVGLEKDSTTTYAVGIDRAETGTIGGGDSLSFKVDRKIAGNDDVGVSITGMVSMGVEAQVSYYVTWTTRLVTFKADVDAGIDVTVTGKVAGELLQLPDLSISVYGVSIGFEPTLTLKFSAAVTWVCTVEFTIGVAYENWRGITAHCSRPKAVSKVEYEGTIFLGIDMNPNVSILDEVVELGIEVPAGFELTAKLAGLNFEKEDSDSPKKKHTCKKCIKGEIVAKVELSVAFDFFKCDALSVSAENLWKFDKKITDFYCSIDYKDLDMGTCPYYTYRVTIAVRDKNGNLQANVPVTTSDGEECGTTNENGVVVYYLPKGTYQLEAEADGIFYGEDIKVKKACKVTLEPVQEGEYGGGGRGSISDVVKNVQSAMVMAHDSALVASGECGAEGDNVTWMLYESGLLNIQGTGDMADYDYNYLHAPWYSYKDSIKKVIVSYGITKIGDTAFYNCSCLTDIELSEGLTTIGKYAFLRCPSLLNIKIPESVTNIEKSAFSGCSSLKYMHLPEGITSIEYSTFSGCSSIISIELPEGVTSIGRSAFNGCYRLTNIEIPKSVTSIDAWAFEDCFGLTSIELPEGITSIIGYTFKGCGIANIKIPEGVASIGESAFEDCYNLTSIELPKTLVTIEERAFASCDNLASIELPDGVTSIEAETFKGCSNLVNIEIPSSVTSIGNSAFYFCQSLVNIEIPSSVASIGDSVFRECSSLKSIDLPEGVTSIDAWAFEECYNLTSIELPKTLVTIKQGAFYNCQNLASIEIPDGVTSIEANAFGYCPNLVNIEIPSSVTSIGDSAFYFCQSLVNIEIPSSVVSIGDSVFQDCFSLKSIDLPEGVTSIGVEAFENCYNLTSIEIPTGVTSIESGAFRNCQNLTSIKFKKSAPIIRDNVFEDVTATAYYPANDTSWTSDILQDYGGTITWVPYTPGAQSVMAIDEGEMLATTSSVAGINVENDEENVENTDSILNVEIDNNTAEETIITVETRQEDTIDTYAIYGGEYGSEET